MNKFVQPAPPTQGADHHDSADEVVDTAGRGTRAPSAAAQHRVLAGEFVAGGLMTLVIFAYSLSFASLVLSGPLAGHVGIAAAATLVSAALAATVSAFFSSMRFAIVAPDTPVIAILGALAASLVVAGRPGLTEHQAVSYAIEAFAVCAATTGAVLLAVGAFKLSKWVRFVPHTVVAAFLGASGWFLVTGAATMAAGTPIDANVLSGADEGAALAAFCALTRAEKAFDWDSVHIFHSHYTIRGKPAS